MHDDTQRTAQNPTTTAGGGAEQAPELNTNTDDVQHLEQTPPYDDDGVLAEQTPGLDPDQIRKDAGPDWPAGTKGDLEAETDPAGGSGTSGSQPSAPSGH